MGAIFPDYVGKIAHDLHFVKFEVDLVVKNASVEGAIASKSIARKEDLLGDLVTDHCLWPVHHGHGPEFQGVAAQFEHVVVVYLPDLARLRIIAFNQLKSLFISHQSNLRIFSEDGFQCSGMVRFHVVDHQVIDLPAVQQVIDLVEVVVDELRSTVSISLLFHPQSGNGNRFHAEWARYFQKDGFGGR